MIRLYELEVGIYLMGGNACKAKLKHLKSEGALSSCAQADILLM